MTLPAVLKKAIPVYAGDSFGVPLILRDEVTQEPSDLSTWGGGHLPALWARTAV